MSLNRYYPQYLNEDTQAEQTALEAMLSLMSTVSAKFYPTAKNIYHCRGSAWIKTSQGEDHLVCVSSIYSQSGSLHVEELLFPALYQKYKDDPLVVKGKQIHIHRAYFDIQPCHDDRYSGHNCLKFFSAQGKSVAISDTEKLNLSITSSSKIYWNAPLPPEGVSAQVRSSEIERDKDILGLSLENNNELQNAQAIWSECFVLNDQRILQPIHLKDFIHIQSAAILEKMSEIKIWLQKIISEPGETKLSPDILEVLEALLADNNLAKQNKFVEAIVKNWSVLLLARQGFNLRTIRTIRELQLRWHPKTINSTLSRSNPRPLGPQNKDLPKDLSYFYHILNGESSAALEAFFKQHNYINYLLDRSYQFSSLQTAIRFGSYHVFETLLNAIDYARRKNHLTPKQYSDLLLANNARGRNTLHILLDAEDPDKMLLFVTTLLKARSENAFTPESFSNFLHQIESWEYTPLFLALQRVNSENFILLIQLLIELLPPAALKKQLITPNLVGFTPLLQALIKGQPENFILLIQLLEESLSTSEFKTQLTQANSFGFTPLIQGLVNGQPENFAILVRLMESKLTDAALSAELTRANAAGFAPLNVGLMNGQPENFAILVRLMESKLSDAVLSAELTKANAAGFTPLMEGLVNGQPDNFAILVRLMESKLSDAALSAELTRVSIAGFTPLISALKNGNPENFRTLVRLLQSKLSDAVLSAELTRANAAGFTPFMEGLVTGQPENFAILVRLMESKLSDAALSAELTKVDHRGYTTLIKALSSANIDTFILYLDAIQKLSKVEQVKLLFGSTDNGLQPLSVVMYAVTNTQNIYFLKIFIDYIVKSFLIEPFLEEKTEREDASISFIARNVLTHYLANPQLKKLSKKHLIAFEYLKKIIDRFEIEVPTETLNHIKLLTEPQNHGEKRKIKRGRVVGSNKRSRTQEAQISIATHSSTMFTFNAHQRISRQNTETPSTTHQKI